MIWLLSVTGAGAVPYDLDVKNRRQAIAEGELLSVDPARDLHPGDVRREQDCLPEGAGVERLRPNRGEAEQSGRSQAREDSA